MPSRSADPSRSRRRSTPGHFASPKSFSASETDAALGRKIRSVLQSAGGSGLEILPVADEAKGQGGTSTEGQAITWEIRARGSRKDIGSSRRVSTTGASKSSERQDRSALDEALDRARARGERRVTEILVGEDMLTGEEFGARIGITRQGVDKRRRAGVLIALEGPARGLRYPDWQIGPEGQMVDGIGDVLALAGGEPWTAYRLLVEPFPDGSEDRVCDVLRRGERERALAQVRGVMEGAAA